jgi:DNA-damage-inducible protein J
MAANAVVRARIDDATKKKAARVLKSIGLTPSSAFRLMMTRIAREKSMPFELLVPNAETVEAMRAGLRDEVRTMDSVDELFQALNAVD